MRGIFNCCSLGDETLKAGDAHVETGTKKVSILILVDVAFEEMNFLKELGNYCK